MSDAASPTRAGDSITRVQRTQRDGGELPFWFYPIFGMIIGGGTFTAGMVFGSMLTKACR